MFGEGDYHVTEKLIRQLLTEANPTTQLPPSTENADQTPDIGSTTPETYLSDGKQINYGGGTKYPAGEAQFTYPTTQPPDSFALQGKWNLDYQGASASSVDARIRLNYHARNVYLVIGGTGTITVTENGQPRTIDIGGPPTLYPIHAGTTNTTGTLEVAVPNGLQAFSFTYG